MPVSGLPTRDAVGHPSLPLYVVNPNASEAVTRSVEANVCSASSEDLPIRCVTLERGPPAIESHADFARAVPCVEAFVRETGERAAGFVVACFSDPGVAEARRAITKPVVGIQEASVALARTLGDRFGIVALVEASVDRQRRSLEAAGMLDSLAGSRPVELGIADLQERERAWPRIRAVGTRLRDEDGADTIVLGCAGMGWCRTDLEDSLGLPVIEPCRAGVAAATARIRAQIGSRHPAAPPAHA